MIPGNDDAIRSTELLTRVVADAVREGRYMAESKGAIVSSPDERSPEEEARVSAEQTMAAQKALAEAAAREARVAAEHAAQARPVVDISPEAATTADEVAEQATSAEEPPETTEEN